VTGGDAIGELVDQRGLGLTVPPGDVAALAAALDRMLSDEEFARACRARVRELVPSLTWSHAVEPLVQFCRAPARAADHLDDELGPRLAWRLAGAETEVPRPRSGLRGWARQVRRLWRDGGPAAVSDLVWGRVRRAMGKTPPDP
jgi:hypothetical protein